MFFSFLGFIIVAACVMTFESRDNAAKVVPSSAAPLNHIEDNVNLKVRSSLAVRLYRK